MSVWGFGACAGAERDVCVGSPALRLGRLVASSLRDASTSLPLLSVLSSLGRKQRWWRCCSQGLRGRFGRSETTGVYVARLWGRGHTFPHFTRRPTHSYRPHRCRTLRAMNTDLPGPGFTTPYPPYTHTHLSLRAVERGRALHSVVELVCELPSVRRPQSLLQMEGRRVRTDGIQRRTEVWYRSVCVVPFYTS